MQCSFVAFRFTCQTEIGTEVQDFPEVTPLPAVSQVLQAKKLCAAFQFLKQDTCQNDGCSWYGLSEARMSGNQSCYCFYQQLGSVGQIQQSLLGRSWKSSLNIMSNQMKRAFTSSNCLSDRQFRKYFLDDYTYLDFVRVKLINTYIQIFHLGTERSIWKCNTKYRIRKEIPSHGSFTTNFI